MDYTAIGDTVNLASRMETTAKPGTILISGYTHKLTKDYFKFEDPEKVQVKGKEEPQEAYGLLSTSDIKTRIQRLLSQALRHLLAEKEKWRLSRAP